MCEKVQIHLHDLIHMYYVTLFYYPLEGFPKYCKNLALKNWLELHQTHSIVQYILIEFFGLDKQTGLPISGVLSLLLTYSARRI